MREQQGVAPEVVLAHVPPTSVDVGATHSLTARLKDIIQRECPAACQQVGIHEVLRHVAPRFVIGSLAINLAGKNVVPRC